MNTDQSQTMFTHYDLDVSRWQISDQAMAERGQLRRKMTLLLGDLTFWPVLCGRSDLTFRHVAEIDIEQRKDIIMAG